MADLSSITLPTGASLVGASGADAKRLQSYLYQLTEQLRYVLANLDSDNMSATYNASTGAAAVKITELTEAQRANVEALKAKITKTAEVIAHDYQSAVAAAKNELTAQVAEQYVAQSADLATAEQLAAYADGAAQTVQSFANAADGEVTATLTSLLESRLTQTSRELAARFSRTEQMVAETADALTAFETAQETCIRFSDEGIEIGKSTDGTQSPYTMRIDNEKLSFLRYGAEVAGLRYNRLYVTAAEISDRLSIGGSAGEGYYDFITTATGLGVKWRAN